jgi:crossover junction endodeoxyribonuclease RuvC
MKLPKNMPDEPSADAVTIVAELPARPAGTRRTLGIDPGTARLGYAVIEEVRNKLTLIRGGVIETSKTLSMPERLLQLFRELSAIVKELQPTEMAVEELFFAKNTTTVISVGQARGIALLVAAEHGLKVHEYKPMQVKQAVHGYGLATKQQVGEMVRILLELPHTLRPDDASDAAAIAICHLHTLRVPTSG